MDVSWRHIWRTYNEFADLMAKAGARMQEEDNARYEESERDYKNFLELKPSPSAAEKELSQMFQAKSSLEVAIDLFNSKIVIKAMDHLDKVVIVFSPECSKAKLLKIKILIAEKDYSGAIAETGYILKSDESNLEALLLRGQAYYYLVDHDVALRHYQKGLRLDPEHSGLKKAYFGLKNLIKKTKSRI
ncbi:dnaJ protein P58IPK homolog isoform X2 [Amborella trichopoda]|uniref:dnaJ protein P58IPK homolog isoform X2 n=1 Tax=Amborella trichopoda TaxID=13333 RepID=UPI0009BFA66F|nr:dnaJ protein P58IPK homolog isoform X2 [Amborella trichopoda]|eukprot:XP_020518735.1 dnaJ protein P58IPK homolog isoform X2 [Amborella trichopoda]